MIRYQRQMLLPQIGIAGQKKLSQSGVLIIGVGGLGCSVAQILSIAGIGRIGLVDFDLVQEHNLHRQVLFQSTDIGAYKVEAAKNNLKLQNPETTILTFNEAATPTLLCKIILDYDIVVDATDQIACRYLINDACRVYRKPWIYGSLQKLEGQWAIFNFEQKNADYRTMFPNPVSSNNILTCDAIGTIAPIPNIIGNFQAWEIIKFLVGMPTEFAKLFHINFTNYNIYAMEISLDLGNTVLTEETFLETDYFTKQKQIVQNN